MPNFWVHPRYADAYNCFGLTRYTNQINGKFIDRIFAKITILKHDLNIFQIHTDNFVDAYHILNK